MATNTNFTSLTQDITNYLERGGSSITDPTVAAQIPRIINAGERKLAQNLKLLGQIEVLVEAPIGLQVSTAVIAKPDRWRSTVSMNYGTGTTGNTRAFLLPRSYEYLLSYWPDRTFTDPSQPPLFYADYDLNHWLVAPTPPQNYPLESVNYMQPRLLDAGNQTNFWTDYVPNCLLYECLMETALFLKDDQRLAMFKGELDQEVQSLNMQDLQRMMDRAAQRRSV